MNYSGIVEEINDYPRIGEGFSQSGNAVDLNSDFMEKVEKYSSSNGKSLQGGKIILIGPAAAGKSCLFRRLVEDKYEDNYKVTIGFDMSAKQYKILGINYSINIWDTSGAERFQSISENYFRDSDAVLLCFDIHDSESYDSIETWLVSIRKNCDKNIKLFLVSCKNDEYSVVDKNEIMDWCEEETAEYFTTSSKTKKNVRKLFRRVVFLVFEKLINEKTKESKIVSKEDDSQFNITERSDEKNEKKGCKCI